MPFHHEEVLPDVGERAEAVLELCRQHGWTLSTAESLTGGLLSAAMVSVPGASDVFRGGLVAYQNDLKTRLLGVDTAVLAERGPVCSEVAEQMARGARETFATDVAISTTGVAGPESINGIKPGTAYVAVKVPSADLAVLPVRLKGDRTAVRLRTVVRALELTEAALRQVNPVN